MKKLKFTSWLLVIMILTVSGVNANYMPGVTEDMSKASYWSEDRELIMSYESIETLNRETIASRGTGMYDLKNQKDSLDGVALNEALKSSSEADASYYLGWTYLGSTELATREDFDEIILNTQNPNAKKVQSTLYGIVVRRSELMCFPTDTPIWDDPKDKDFDYRYLSSLRVNEPLVITSVSADGRFYLAKNICCSGWVSADAVAICRDKAEWLSAWDTDPAHTLVVWGDKVYTEYSLVAPETSELMLTMGTTLEMAEESDPDTLVDNRAVYNNHVVYLPVRKDDGTYSKKPTLISRTDKVSAGYLPLTREAIARVSLEALGNTYGWGGSMHSDDCSGFVRNVYKCFGMELARNTTWQCEMPMGKIDMKNMCKEERVSIMDSLPLGTILYFNGHEMLYLGKRNDHYYVISSVGNIMHPQKPGVIQRIRSTIINNLEVKRGNGNTWLEDLTMAIVPYYEEGDSRLPTYQWYHDGVAYCLENNLMKGDENKFFNPGGIVTWAEVLQVMSNIMDEDKTPGDKVYENWYDEAVELAVDKELISHEITDFHPQKNISRQELADVLYRYARQSGADVGVGEDTNILSYDDAEDIADYAVLAMQFVAGAGVMRGKTDTTLCPQDSTTRAELATVLKNFFEWDNQSSR